jgi:hypothetical protein
MYQKTINQKEWHIATKRLKNIKLWPPAFPGTGDVLTQSGVAAVPEEDLEAVRVVA